MRKHITPGEILVEEYLKPMGISQSAMARAIGVAPGTISMVVRGKRPVTPKMSILFGAFFGQSEMFWHGIQTTCDLLPLHKEKKKLKARVKPATSLAS